MTLGGDRKLIANKNKTTKIAANMKLGRERLNSNEKDNIDALLLSTGDSKHD